MLIKIEFSKEIIIFINPNKHQILNNKNSLNIIVKL